jgi:hypothetical protein
MYAATDRGVIGRALARYGDSSLGDALSGMMGAWPETVRTVG